MRKNKLFNKIALSPLALMPLFALGCGNATSSLKAINEEVTKEAMANFVFDYEYATPGASLTYNYLWDGTNVGEKEASRHYFSFLSEYKESDNTYYLAYLKQSKIAEYKSYMRSYEENNDFGDQNYHFVSYGNEKVIDGKYYFAFQKDDSKENDEVKYYSSGNINDIAYKMDDYQLVFACLTKKALIKKNLSKNETINKEISLCIRVELSFDNTNLSPKEYIFETREKINQDSIKESFDYLGEKIEVYPESYKEKKYASFPTLGMDNRSIDSIRANIINEDNAKYILLPRYMKSSGNKKDLLDEETTLQPNEDVFGKHKKEFNDAFVKDYNDLEGLFDYSKVIEIMKIK